MAENKSWWAGSDAQEQAQNQSPPSFEPTKIDVAQASEEELLTRRIHILGMGSIGSLIAHSLRTIPQRPPITLMMHRRKMYDEFRSSGSLIRLVNQKTELNDSQKGYDCDVREDRTWHYQPHFESHKEKPANPLTEGEAIPDSGENFIYSLIVTVKAQHTVDAMRTIRHRVDSRTTICFMQNGLGQIDEINAEVFTDPATRPTYLLGIISHGCYMSGPVTVHHAGFGVTSLGIYRDTDKYPLPPKHLASSSISPLSDLDPADRAKHYPTDAEMYAQSLSARYLLRTLTRTPTLACAAYPYLDLLQLQLEKLSANAILNPLTSIFDVPNGAMLNNSPLSTIQNMLLAELSLVIRSLPELQTIPALAQRFSTARLKDLFTNVATKTAENSSSMREDIRKARLATEINYINGYIVKRGEEVGIQAVLNYMVVQMVKAKTLLGVQRGFDEVPFAGGVVEGEIQKGKLGKEGGVVLEDISGEPRWRPSPGR